MRQTPIRRVTPLARSGKLRPRNAKRRDIENAHIRGDGAGRKADAKLTVPLCRGHHRTRADSLHQLQPRAFEQQHHLNLELEATRVEALWRAVTPIAGDPE